MRHHLKLFYCLIAIITITACKKNSNTTTTVSLPGLTTTTITNITGFTSTSGGSVSSDGGGAVSVRGVCWSINPNPTISDNKTYDGPGTGSFTSSISGLTSNTTYYVRAYATNSAGTGYGNDISFATSFICGNSTIKDADGNVYHTDSIGTQCWTVENLTTSKFNDLTNIPTGLDDVSWQTATTPAYAIYNNSASNNSTYGKLYNWYAVNTGLLAPTGWHIPSKTEWLTLENYLGGYSVAGGKMKNTSPLWSTPNLGADNSSGFTAIPGGDRDGTGAYVNMADDGVWWTSTTNTSTTAYYRYQAYSCACASSNSISKNAGCSIRCIKN